MAFSVLTGTAGVAAILSAGSTAQADPGFTSAFVGVGADVTQDVYAGLSGESPQPPTTQTVNFFTPIHSTAATNNETIASFDAFPAGGTTVEPGCIITKVGGPSFDRPNSTTAGITALLADINGTGFENSSGSCTGTPVDPTGQIDFARAARGPKTSGDTLTFIPYARDALGILADDNGTGNLADLSTTQLTDLYTSSTGTITVGSDTVYGCLTIAGSSPRTNLESALDITDAQATTAATAAGCNSITQNDGNAFATFTATLPKNAEAVIPISSGSWIGQANQLALDRSNVARSDGYYLSDVASLGQPYTGTAPNLLPNRTYYESTQFGYNLYTVVPTSSISGFGANAALENLFESAICTSAEQTIINDFGFDSLVSAEGTCGATTTTGDS
ncbi:MAG: hypothetical protein WBG41_06090 [Acidimicrobiales bacterium]